MHSIQPKKNTKRLAVIALAVIVCAVLLAAVNFTRNWIEYRKARALNNPVAATPTAIAAGKQLYENHCQKCHGSNGDGKGPKAAELSSSPGDFTNAGEMNRRTDGELFWVITKGRSQMPEFKDKISEEGRWQLVNYIRTFEPRKTVSNAVAPDQSKTKVAEAITVPRCEHDGLSDCAVVRRAARLAFTR